MIRTTATVLGGVALTVLGAGVASAAPLVAEPPTAPAETPVAGNPVRVLDHAPVPIEDPTFGVFDVQAPVHGALGGVH
ncbi:hypothetical protein [Pseudonocardia xishanensis]|uniref:Uncharacterized protein n=1 Tax=Pseudonocardia xishanensis TaxID=630995 RepID=A0ABP8RYY0_9PSEU